MANRVNQFEQRGYLVILLALVSLAALPCPALAGWKAGVAKQMITPGEFMWMAGYGSRDHAATGKLNDLWAKTLLLEDEGGTRVAIITLDLVGISRDLAEPIYAQLQQKYQLDRARVAICCSHTHSGPVVGQSLRSLHYDLLDDGQKQLADRYAAQLLANVVDLVGRAIADLRPSEISWGQGVATFAVNRRNNKEPDVPQLRAAGQLVGPLDHSVPVLKIADAQGKLKAVLFGYACHATVLSGYDWSSDYPGFAQTKLEEAHPGCTALFFAGCGADQNPLPRRTPELARQYGEELAAAVEDVLKKTLEPISGTLVAKREEITLDLARVPERAEIEQDLKVSDRFVAARARRYLAQLDAGKKIEATYDYPIQVWRLGPKLVFVTLGGEVVVDYANRIKHELGADTTWVAAYTNDVMAYIPSRRVLAEGGYEGAGAMVYYSLPSPWAPMVEDAIVQAVGKLAGKSK